MDNAIVITGGTSGIGAATIERLLAGKRQVINLDVEPASIAGVRHIQCDLANPDSIINAVNQLPAVITALINVAGVAQDAVPNEQVMTVNFLGMRQLTETVLPRIADGGRIVLVASSAGRDWRTNASAVNALLETRNFADGVAWLRQHPELWQPEPYKFSKQCAAAYTYRAAGLAWPRQINVNCVNPGIVDTQLSPQFRDMVGAKRYDWIVAQSGRAGTPNDIAPIIEFLATGDCQWLNGVEITVDGGYFAGLEGHWINAADMPSG